MMGLRDLKKIWVPVRCGGLIKSLILIRLGALPLRYGYHDMGVHSLNLQKSFSSLGRGFLEFGIRPHKLALLFLMGHLF